MRYCVDRGWSTDVAVTMLVYVDDYLCAVTHDHHEELAAVAGALIDEMLVVMGIDNAVHKAVGLVDCLEWLGLLIDARPGIDPCVGLTEVKPQPRQACLGPPSRLITLKYKTE